MKLTGPACTEAMNGTEEAGRRERAEGNADGVRVERGVRPCCTGTGVLAIVLLILHVRKERLSRFARYPFAKTKNR